MIYLPAEDSNLEAIECVTIVIPHVCMYLGDGAVLRVKGFSQVVLSLGGLSFAFFKLFGAAPFFYRIR